MDLGAVKFHSHVVPLYAEPQTNLSLWILPASIVLVGFLTDLPKSPLRTSYANP